MAIGPNLPHETGMETSETIRLGENLNRLMKKRKITLSQTAKAIEMNKSTLHNYCNGVIPRNILTLKKLADYFEIGLNELLFGPQPNRDSFIRAALLEGKYELIIRRTDEELRTTQTKG